MRHFHLLLLLLALPLFAHGQLLINEIQSSNGITVVDEDGDNQDWLELYNAGNQAVNLDGYWLSDDDDNPQRWRLPAVTIGAGDTLLVWASNKNRATPGSPLHTNFAISAGGEEILLSAPNGDLLDRADPVPIATDISWGRSPDGADNWVFFAEPTPGASNTTPGYTELLAAPEFSVAGGFYANAFDLSLNHPDPAVTIIYTLDGSIPDPDSIGGVSYSYKNSYPQNTGNSEGALLENSFYSFAYSDSISIVDRSPEPNKLASIATSFDNNPYYIPNTPITKGTVVRARAFKDGGLTSPIATHTYFINDSGQSPHQLAVISLGIQEDGLFDYENGIHVAGSRFDQWRAANPFANADGASEANWQMRGDAWERLAHIELFEPGATRAGLKQDIGVRIHGGWSRAHRQKSLRLYARNAYGDSRFNYPMFPDQDSSGYNRLMLRNSGNDNDYTMFRDAMMQALGAELRMDTQAYRPT
ncbi:MAG TPA: lamin tail domain-containing protein, partial [Cellvibrionaceae bacterium]